MHVLSFVLRPGPNLQPNERYESLPRNQDQVMPTAEADMKEEAAVCQQKTSPWFHIDATVLS